MIKITEFENQKVAILGLGRTGTSAALALKEGKAQVFAWDDKADSRLQAESEGVPVSDLSGLAWDQFSALILSPGIVASHPYAVKAAQAGVPIYCDIELLARADKKATFIGVTGTNGKSTTTSLISYLLKASDHQVEMGGNIGKAALDLKVLEENGTYVLELSSYQLERTFTPFLKTAVFLNVTPDHLERHGDIAGYVRAKERIFDLQKEAQNVVIGIDDEECFALYQRLLQKKTHRIVPISTLKKIPEGVYVEDGILIDDRESKAEKILDLKTIQALPGSHNWQNIAAAYVAVGFEGLNKSQFVSHLHHFQNLPHRLQEVAVIDGIHFINDSKATNSDATAKALACYKKNIFWILGGRAKANGLEGLEDYFSRIRQAFLMGEAESQFAAYLEGQVDYVRCHTLEKAVQEAYMQAIECQEKPAYVLLSPACASWDQFKDFEHRGEVFQELVRKLCQKEEVS